MRGLLSLLIILLLACPALAGHFYHESWYQAKWCANNQGVTEVVLPDRTRCDCLTATHAIEFDFAAKWAEAIGQSLRYGMAFEGRRAGVVLIIEAPEEYRYLERVRMIIDHYGLPIDVWAMEGF